MLFLRKVRMAKKKEGRGGRGGNYREAQRKKGKRKKGKTGKGDGRRHREKIPERQNLVVFRHQPGSVSHVRHAS